MSIRHNLASQISLKARLLAVLTAVFFSVLILTARGEATIPGFTGKIFNFTAREGYISTPDGNSVYMWGYANGTAQMQYPGPTLIINQGDTITVYLTNQLTVPVSIIFPGQEQVTTIGGTAGLLTAEAAPSGGIVSYSFTAAKPGTYLYHSGTRPELQIEMGLVGALIIRPQGFDPQNPRAYQHADTGYDYEYLFLLTEMDSSIHELIKCGKSSNIDNTRYWPVYWFINGRNAPDTMAPAFSPWQPNQPYNCLPRMHPGDRMLMRVIGAGRDLHPFHQHGNHAKIIARDGRLLESQPDISGPDLGPMVFTILSVPGETVDAIFEWTGEKLGWDIYGHSPDDPLEPHEYAPDHGKPFPVTLPEQQTLTFGAMYSGSPFLGDMASMPPGDGGMNMNGGFFYMWHSHTEKEMVNFDIFPGGNMTMMIIEPPGVPIPK